MSRQQEEAKFHTIHPNSSSRSVYSQSSIDSYGMATAITTDRPVSLSPDFHPALSMTSSSSPPDSRHSQNLGENVRRFRDAHQYPQSTNNKHANTNYTNPNTFSVSSASSMSISSESPTSPVAPAFTSLPLPPAPQRQQLHHEQHNKKKEKSSKFSQKNNYPPASARQSNPRKLSVHTRPAQPALPTIPSPAQSMFSINITNTSPNPRPTSTLSRNLSSGSVKMPFRPTTNSTISTNGSSSTVSLTSPSSSSSSHLQPHIPSRLAPNLTGPAETALTSVLSHAKYFQDPDVRANLKLLTTDGFDDIVQNGFFTHLGPQELSHLEDVLSSHVYTGNHSNNNIAPSSSTPPPEFARPHISSRSSSFIGPSNDDNNSSNNNADRYSLRQILSSSTIASTSMIMPPSLLMLDREPTLKLTLTPESMRADERLIYGWQQDHIEDDNEKISHQYKPLEDTKQSLFIPAGGLGADVSSSKKVKRVFGKLRRPRATTNAAYMITSSDVQ